jgi:type IV secretion system protein VirB8
MSMIESDNHMSPTKLYLEEANEWARDRLDIAHKRAKFAYVIAGVFAILAMLAIAAVVALTPLKEVDGFLVVADKMTGQIEVISSLKKNSSQVQSLTEDSAVTKSNLAQYVIARETFDLTDIEERHNQVRRTSERKIFDEYDRTFTGTENLNPFKMFEGSVRTVEIKSVEFFNERTGQVRFLTHLKKDGSVSDRHWVAIVQFRYVQTPVELKDRLANPLGFQVTSYRIDQESIE